MNTRITQLLGIDFPIIQASMAWIADAGLAAAVSQSGGLGTIGPNAGSKTVITDVDETGERLRAQINKCRELTDRPFAVNFVVGVGGQDRCYSEKCVEVGIEERVPVAIVSQGSPAVYTKRLKVAGITVMQVCSTVRHARKAQDCGVDAIITSGAEGGGHSGFDMITSFCLVPQVADAVKIPVVAGGGVGDARGLLAALSLGAEGVYMGTRFIMTRECPAHESAKELILKAGDTDTIAVGHGARGKDKKSSEGDRGFVEERRGAIRLIVNDFLTKFFKEKGEFVIDDSFNFMKPFLSGKLHNNTITAGQVSGLVKELPACRDLIKGMVSEAESVLGRVSRVFSHDRDDY
ncbi:MAG: nitronate monooxygenase [Deltaproteobacteria bacterium]|nr:nitronate monooxygenase [Deltaproteobacteria bacterium]MBW2053240.1 nitronate monooxygenase [Deltaproteobacteria bacterium]MBW2141795.1 nitronate monooxygenase [Deltaproteobacteria bacterium]MBW2324689.1 nitronate monooxygenase [Deltaproteobacteria bacterium]